MLAKQKGTRHAGKVDAAMLVTFLSLGRQERVDHKFWNRLDRQISRRSLEYSPSSAPSAAWTARGGVGSTAAIIWSCEYSASPDNADQPRDGGHANQKTPGSDSEPGNDEPTSQRFQKLRLSPLRRNVRGLISSRHDADGQLS